MARIAVTGGSGKLGRAVVTRPAEHGYDVINLDRARPASTRGHVHRGRPHRLRPDRRGAEPASTTAYDRMDARRAPRGDPRARAATERGHVRQQHRSRRYNVFAAARAAGIRNVVWASSETVLGLPFDTPPPYIPVDEEYPVRPETTYSLAKALEEQMAAQSLPVGPGAEDDRPAVLQRHGAAGLRRVPGVRRRPARCASGTCGATSTPATARRRSAGRSSTSAPAWTCSSSPTPTPSCRRPSADLAAEVFPGVESRRARPARDPAVDRQGAPGAGLRAAALLARSHWRRRADRFVQISRATRGRWSYG